MWIKPKRYTALLFGSPDHYERVVFTSIDGGWGDFELLRYNGKIPRSRYVIVYDRRYAIAQSEKLGAILKNEWNYIISEFKTIIPDKNVNNGSCDPLCRDAHLFKFLEVGLNHPQSSSSPYPYTVFLCLQCGQIT